MAIDTSIPRTRRALIAGGIGGFAAIVASALGRPLPVRAGTDGDVRLGLDNPATTTTKVTIPEGNGTIAIWGASTNGTGIHGSSTLHDGVWGLSLNANGVLGHSNTGIGVHGSGEAAIGVQGTSASAAGVVGRSNGNSTGLLGYSGGNPSGPIPAAPAKTGVYGYAIQDTQAIGVKGQTTVGTGVQGIASTGIGSRGAATTGTGVYASATTGAAILAVTSGPKSGLALRTVGRVRFDNSVGIATIAAGASSVTVTPGIDLTATSAVVATLQGDAGGSTTVKRVVIDATADTFTIYLTANSTATVKVAWHVFG